MTHSLENTNIPSVTIKQRKDNQWEEVNTKDLFENKKVIVFSLPGAFTPTCSTNHVPRFNELAPALKMEGIDKIICVSVNDTFVMNEWSKDLNADEIEFLPDGNGEFSEKMGMLVDKQDLGFGKRSWRYSMYVENGIIKKVFSEPDVPGDPYEVSDADTMTDYLFPKMKKPQAISLLAKVGCPHCTRAKELLDKQGLKYEVIELNKEITPKSIRAISGRSSTPQVFIDGKHIGGADDLEKYLK